MANRRTQYEIFEDKYKPHQQDGELKQYDWTNKDEWQKIVQAQKESKVWTCTDYEGKCYLSAGISYVNRLFYVITENPYNNDTSVYLW